jgi:hypothetical protein
MLGEELGLMVLKKKEKICPTLVYIKVAQGNLQKCFTWPKISRKNVQK